MDISNVADELNSWYEKNCSNGNLTWSFLSRRSGVSVSQICKIAKGHVASPKYQTVKSLLEALYPDDNAKIYEYLVKHFPKHTIRIKGLSEEERSVVSDFNHQLFRDGLTFRLFKIAQSNSVKVSDLEKEFGANQIRPRVDALVNGRYIEVREDGVISRSKNFEKTAASEITTIAEGFHHAVEIVVSKKLVARNTDSEIDEIFNRLTYYHSTFSSEALASIAKETEEFVNYIISKYSSPKFKGDIPAFLNIATGRFDNK